MTRALICSLTLSLLAAMPALAQDGPITASGNEPFWRVDVAQGDLTLTRPGVDDLILPVTQRAEMDGFAAISAPDPDRALRALLLLSPEICRDTMTGMPHPRTAQLALGDQVYDGCAGAPEDLLAAQDWQIVEIGGEPALPDVSAVLSFDGGGRLSGSGGCNRLTTSYTLTGEGLTIEPSIATTMMACPEPQMAQERAVLDALRQVGGFDIDDTGTLILRGSGDALIRAEAMPE